ncbi:transposase [Streptomyces sp. NPDC015171]|uniref:transposase n=1 Tax=Streptomyces sp. NPDC015171 TaxID=3364945 RepID=UPI0037004EA1
MGRRDLTSGQWARLEPLLPTGFKPGRARVWTRRQLIDGIRRRTRTGTPRRDVPERHGPWDQVYDLFRRRQWRDGTRTGILTPLQAETDASGLITWVVTVDATACRAHQHAAGAAKEGGLQEESPSGIRRAGWPAMALDACGAD